MTGAGTAPRLQAGPQLQAGHLPAGPSLAVADLGRRLRDLGAGERLVLVGLGTDGFAAAIAESRAASSDAAPGLLTVAADRHRDAEAIVGGLLDDLADLALARWPDWHREEPARDGVRAPSQAPSHASSHAPWRKAAERYAAAGHRPRLRRAGAAVEFAQLRRVLDPAGPVLVAEVDPACPARAAPVVAALEWCARHGAPVVALLPAAPPPVPPYDRILYGAQALLREPAPAAARFLPPCAAPRSRAHPASETERRVEAALRADAELGPLFACNAPVPLGALAPRVDLLWPEGRVVVELDGPEHRADPLFSADRHRDYELLAAGYLVLRITNGQVEADLQRAVEKIRTVVRLRRREDMEIR